MTAAEVQEFEERLESDVALQQTLTQYRQQDNYLAYRANGGLLPQELDQLSKESWGELDSQRSDLNLDTHGPRLGSDTQRPSSGRTLRGPGEKGATIRPLRRYLSLAAAVALLLLAGWWLLSGEKALNGPSLYASQMVIPRLDNSIRGATDPADSLYQLAVNTYSSGDYANARPLLDDYLENYAVDSELLLAYAVASLEEGEFTEAEIALRSLEQSGSLLSAEAPFYRALSQLKQGNVSAAKAILSDLPASDQKMERLKTALGL